jgi:hypothetical protein
VGRQNTRAKLGIDDAQRSKGKRLTYQTTDGEVEA